MNSTHIISQDVFDKIRSRFRNLEMGDEQGAVTTDPKEARFFDFDFVVEEHNLGRVSISINEIGALKLFYSQSILEDTDDFVHHLWYDFLREMRMFAKRRLLRFDTRDITKSNLNKDDFQYLANQGAPKETEMNESKKFEGSSKTSYRVLEKTKLIAKHKKKIEDESYSGARSNRHNISALFIENSEGERFKYPFIHIAGATAMQRHVANGGRPYDDIGNTIIKMSEQIAQLSDFKKHVRGDGLNQAVNEITSRTDMKLESLKRQVEGLSKQHYYEKWAENFVPNNSNVTLDQATLEDYKSKFTVSSFKENIAQYFPLIHSIMQETSTVDLEDYVCEGDECEVCHEDPCKCDDKDDKKTVEGFASFERWIDRVAEGKLEPDAIMDLKDLLDSGLTLDNGGESAIDALQGIGIHDEKLEKQLMQLADPENGQGPDADPKETILAWLADPLGGDDMEAAQELGFAGGGEPNTPPPEMGDGGDEEPVGEDDEEDGPMPGSKRDIAELVYSMFNKEHSEEGLGPFPKGRYGVLTIVKKKFGEEAVADAEKCVDYLENEYHTQTEGSIQGGVWTADPPQPGQPNVPAPSGDPESAPTKTPGKVTTIEPGSAIRVAPTPTPPTKKVKEAEEFDIILKLAGLAK